MSHKETKTVIPNAMILTEMPNQTIVSYDPNTDEIVIDNPKPIKIRVKGGLSLHFGDDLDFTVDGELNLLTREHPIALDSVGSSIYFNSFMCKQIRDLEHTLEFRKKMKELEEQERERVTKSDCRHHNQEGCFLEVLDVISDFEKRISEMEERFKSVIDVSPSEDSNVEHKSISSK